MATQTSVYAKISPLFTTVERARALWDTAERLAQVGTWEWNRRTDTVLWSDSMYRLMGYEPGEVTPAPELLFARIHPADVERMQSRFLAHKEGKAALASSEFRFVAPDGTVRHLCMTPLGWERDEDGSEDRLVGFTRDLTEQRAAERELALHRAVGRSLAAWRSFDVGGRDLLREVVHALGVAAGVLWLPQGELLVARAVWCVATVDQAMLRRLVGNARLTRGASLTGRAWERRESCFLARDEPSGGVVPEALVAALDGLRPHVAVPAMSEGEVLAVMSVYSAEPSDVGQRMANSFSALGAQLGQFLRGHPALASGEALSARELEVLALAADGLNRQEVERQLGLSPATVKTHFEHIYRKLGVTNRAAAVAHALRRGLIS